jgi:hypothetical protein
MFTNLFGHSNDIYMQISLIMLIGLLAKNAILIVQFALARRQTGMAIRYSAILGAARTSTSYPDDLAGHDYRSAAPDVCFGRGQER